MSNQTRKMNKASKKLMPCVTCDEQPCDKKIITCDRVQMWKADQNEERRKRRNRRRRACSING